MPYKYVWGWSLISSPDMDDHVCEEVIGERVRPGKGDANRYNTARARSSLTTDAPTQRHSMRQHLPAEMDVVQAT
jgi:hypothetical protein